MLLKTLLFAGFTLAIGPAFFWRAIWLATPAPDDAEAPAPGESLARRLRWLAIAGSLLYAAASLAEVVRATLLVADWSQIARFIQATQLGKIGVARAALALAYAGVIAVAAWELAPADTEAGSRPPAARRAAWGLAAAAGLLMAAGISLTSHAAAGRHGLFPVVTDVVHVLAAGVWTGGVAAMVAVPWRAAAVDATVQRLRWTSRLVGRFSALGLWTVAGLAVTGVVAATLHLYGPAALPATPYGRTFLAKLAFIGAALAIAATHLTILRPAMRRLGRPGRFAAEPAAALIGRFGRLIRVEGVALLAVLIATGGLTTLPPAERPGTAPQSAWRWSAPGLLADVRLTPAASGRVTLDVALTDGTGGPVIPDAVIIRLRMLEHDMGISQIRAEPVGSGRFRGEGVLTMAGRWEVTLTVERKPNPPATWAREFTTATGTADLARSRRIAPLAALVTWPAIASAATAGFLLIAGLLGIAVVAAGRVPGWMAALSLALLALGAYQGLRAVQVDAYPTTFVANPLPYTQAAAAEGRRLFVANCASCHGNEARGDGPLASYLNPRPADLAAPHVDPHRDGDLFWWISKGMEGTAMPGFEGILTEYERWTLVHYIRSLRRPLPER